MAQPQSARKWGKYEYSVILVCATQEIQVLFISLFIHLFICGILVDA
jgi:hypothetical protein